LRLRRDDSVFRDQDIPLDGATLTLSAFVIRWFAPDEGDRLLLVNLGTEIQLDPGPEPLLAPPLGRHWQLLWASEDPRYGGHGVILPTSTEERWRLPAECAVALLAASLATQ